MVGGITIAADLGSVGITIAADLGSVDFRSWDIA